MLIIHGTRAKLLGQGPEITSCPQCAAGTTTVRIFQRYAHLFWIPLFPVGRKAIRVCDNCKTTNEIKGAHPFYERFKTPLSTFSGSALLAVFVAYVYYSAHAETARVQRDLQTLRTGDSLILTSKARKAYALVRILRIEGTHYQLAVARDLYPTVRSAREAAAAGVPIESNADVVEAAEEMIRESKIEDVLHPLPSSPADI